MTRRAIHSASAPRAIGPYSHAILDGDTLFLSGQTPIDPATGKLIDGDVAAQTRRVLENLSAVLAAADMTLANVVKTTIYLLTMEDFQAVNAAYASFFGDAPPARATVAVAGLPLGARVEIEAVARR